HHWVTVSHVGGRGDFGHIFKFTTRYLFDFLGSETALLNPIFFVGMVWAGAAFWRTRPRDPRMIYFFSMGAPEVFAYLLQSFHARVLPNWIAPAIVPLLFVMVLYWDQYRRRPWVRRAFYTGLVVGLAAMVFLSDTEVTKIVTGHYLSASRDPLRRLRGWQGAARVAGEARQNLLKEGKPAFIICPEYGSTSLITFYLPEAKAAVPGQPIVYCWGADQPITEFYFWLEYRYWLRVGDNAIFINFLPLASGKSSPIPASESPPMDLVRQFHSVKSLGIFHADYHGRPVRWFQLFECRDQS
ncbi:MAG: hypothetical protein ACREDQ_09820, partial [Limisphaerales bacterium]